jgi:hypothetical protein
MIVVTVMQTSSDMRPVPVVGTLNGWAGFYQVGGNKFAPLARNTYFFTSVTPQLQRLAMRVFTSGEIFSYESPCGANCTYTTVFDGPAYSCVDSTTTGGGDSNALLYEGVAHNESHSPSGITIHRNLREGTLLRVTNCTLHAATYTTQVNYTENIRNMTTSVQLLETIPNNIFSKAVDIPMGLVPQDQVNRSLSLVNFWVIEKAVQGLLSGSLVVLYEDTIEIEGSSNIQLWNFVEYGAEKVGLSFPSNFSTRIEELLMNTTLSLVYFLQNPIHSQIDGIAAEFGGHVPPSLNSPASATMQLFSARYSYSASTLWAIYGTSLGVSILAIIFGCFMRFINGVDADMSFSQVLVTTRNPTLDELCYGSCMGGDRIDKKLRKTKLRFGKLNEDGMAEHACFGLEDEITTLRKGDECMGYESIRA